MTTKINRSDLIDVLRFCNFEKYYFKYIEKIDEEDEQLLYDINEGYHKPVKMYFYKILHNKFLRDLQNSYLIHISTIRKIKGEKRKEYINIWCDYKDYPSNIRKRELTNYTNGYIDEENGEKINGIMENNDHTKKELLLKAKDNKINVQLKRNIIDEDDGNFHKEEQFNIFD